MPLCSYRPGNSKVKVKIGPSSNDKSLRANSQMISFCDCMFGQRRWVKCYIDQSGCLPQSKMIEMNLSPLLENFDLCSYREIIALNMMMSFPGNGELNKHCCNLHFVQVNGS